MSALSAALRSLPSGPKARSSLCLAAAVVLLANPLYLAYWHPGDAVYRYEAVEATPDGDGGLAFRTVDGGLPERHLRVEGVLCTGLGSRECSLEYAIHDGELDVNGSEPPRSYRYVRIDGQLYEPAIVGDRPYGELTHEPVDPETVLRELGRDDPATGRVADAVESGAIYTHQRLDDENEVVWHDGSYYVVHAAAVKRYGPRGTTCGSDGGGFCERADELRTRQRLLAWGATLAGLALAWRALRRAWAAG